MKTFELKLTTQEMAALMKAIGVANMQPDMDKTDRMVVTWVADRIERELNAHLRDGLVEALGPRFAECELADRIGKA